MSYLNFGRALFVPELNSCRSISGDSRILWIFWILTALKEAKSHKILATLNTDSTVPVAGQLFSKLTQENSWAAKTTLQHSQKTIWRFELSDKEKICQIGYFAKKLINFFQKNLELLLISSQLGRINKKWQEKTKKINSAINMWLFR